MARTPREVFQHHAEAPGAADLDGIVSDYADDAQFTTPEGVRRGKDRVRDGSSSCSTTSSAPIGSCRPTQLYEYDVLLLAWKAESDKTKADDGIDTFIFRDGLIRVQTVR